MRTLLLTALFLVPTASFAAPFSDVPDTHANAEAIAYVKAEGIVEGYADGTFKADATINRAEFTKILIMQKFSDVSSGACDAWAPYNDVPLNSWFAPFVCYAKAVGFVDGYSGGVFKPAHTINFAEAAKILVKAFELEASMTIPACEGDCPWYRDYVLMLEMRNAIPVSITGLDQAITRGEMAEMIYRLKTGNTDGASRTYDMLELRTATPEETGLSFSLSYPAWWGELVMQEEYEGDHYRAWGFTGLQRTPWNAHVTVQAKRDGLQFTTKCSGRMDCPLDADFETYRSMFRSNRTLASGIAVEVDDGYSPGGGAFYRNAYFFRGDHYVAAGGSAAFAMYDEEYMRRQARGEQPSITELVLEDIADFDPHPMETVFRLHPHETVAEQRFFSQLDAMIGSIR